MSQHNSCQSSLDEITAKKEELTQKEEMVSCLQEELFKVRLREAENEALIRDLRSKIQDLEQVSDLNLKVTSIYIYIYSYVLI